MGLRAWDFGVWVKGLGFGSGLQIGFSGFFGLGLGFKVPGSGYGVYLLGCGIGLYLKDRL